MDFFSVKLHLFHSLPLETDVSGPEHHLQHGAQAVQLINHLVQKTDEPAEAAKEDTLEALGQAYSEVLMQQANGGAALKLVDGGEG